MAPAGANPFMDRAPDMVLPSAAIGPAGGAGPEKQQTGLRWKWKMWNGSTSSEKILLGTYNTIRGVARNGARGAAQRFAAGRTQHFCSHIVHRPENQAFLQDFCKIVEAPFGGFVFLR